MIARRKVRGYVRRVAVAIRAAAERGIWDGQNAADLEPWRYFDRATGTSLIYSRETGYHSSGWCKNPAYERCYHLSLSFRDSFTLAPVPFDKRLSRIWCEEVLRDMGRFAWYESPASDEGKRLGVHHWRVFCDPSWAPIVPPKEVYSRDATPAGYRTTSEQAAHVR